MDDFWLQLLFALAMLITTLLAGLAPLKLLTAIMSNGRTTHKVACSLSLLSCFAGGVFLATCFLDVIPHVNSNFRMFNKNSSLNTVYPLPELLFCVGFFLVYLIEEICSRLISGSTPTSQTSSMSSIAESLNKTETVTLQSITFTVAMSFHSILEGLALGVQDDRMAITTLFISLMLHKGIEAFSVGLQIAKSNSQQIKIAALTIFIYSLMTPIGSLIGVYIQEQFDLITEIFDVILIRDDCPLKYDQPRFMNAFQSASIRPVLKEGLIFVLEALAVGTFIYVTFFEVLAEEKANEFSNIVQLFAIIAGFSVIALFQFVEILVTGTESH
ncbi:unnamed protein product [Anisakis simplex]|uniref:Zinc transporter ZIP2 (inferred by orthology to a human protein) n=1 Tax=Anisakis simplex TaxID=6269 RepID=A0A0M3JSB9_ANISI|nr:unnamed protein product [Anisakis simplex]